MRAERWASSAVLALLLALLTAAPAAADSTLLVPGHPVRDALRAGESRRYHILTPLNATALVVETFDAMGDVDLYVRKDAIPTDVDYDFASALPSGDELVTVSLLSSPPLAQGTWNVLVLARSNARYEIAATTVLDETPPYTASWSSAESDLTNSVALGDVDGDGHIDLVCGNEEQDHVYLSEGAGFSNTPHWSSPTSGVTKAAALSDVDGDGDLDLVLAGDNPYLVVYLYRNDEGMFAASPAWSATDLWPTKARNYPRSVALGDVNGDGNPDLVVGNRRFPDRLYLGDGNTFQTNPSWSPALLTQTYAIAMGDVDGDGDLDMVCGNDGPNQLFLNERGLFASAPAWLSGETGWTWAVALGDVDGDGDLELARLSRANGRGLRLRYRHG